MKHFIYFARSLPHPAFRHWAEMVWQLKNGSMREQNEIFRTVMTSLNHKGLVRTRGDLDPHRFSTEAAQRAVLAALASAASVREGPKLMTMPFAPEAFEPGVKLKKG